MKNILNNIAVRLLMNILLVALFLVVLFFLFKVVSDRQLHKDCLNAQRQFLEYNVPIQEDLHSLCVEYNYYK